MTLLIRPLVDPTDLCAWAQVHRLDVVPSAWHVTLARDLPPKASLDGRHLVLSECTNRRVIRLGGFIVLSVVVPSLVRRHRQLIRAGASWNHRRFLPHLTIAADDRRDLSDFRPFAGKLHLGSETVVGAGMW